MKPRIPPEVKAEAEAAQKRLDDAISELMVTASMGYLPSEDDFHLQMVEMINSGRNVVRLNHKRKQ